MNPYDLTMYSGGMQLSILSTLKGFFKTSGKFFVSIGNFFESILDFFKNIGNLIANYFSTIKTFFTLPLKVVNFVADLTFVPGFILFFITQGITIGIVLLLLGRNNK